MSPEVRPPAVAGLFYEREPGALLRTVRAHLAAGRPLPPVAAESWRALLLPHAGHVYSGRIAGAGAASVVWPKTALLLGPDHTGAAAPLSLSPAAGWATPLGIAPTSARLTEILRESLPDLEPDAAGHAREHALEVLLPFLQVVRPDIEVVCVTVSAHDLALCLRAGEAVAKAVARFESEGLGRVALVVSSDMNHYLPKLENEAKDLRAIAALIGGDPAALFERVLSRERISMCGVLPATVVLAALRRLGGAKATLVARGDSSDASGDDGRVVGYASVLWRCPGAAPEGRTAP